MAIFRTFGNNDLGSNVANQTQQIQLNKLDKIKSELKQIQTKLQVVSHNLDEVLNLLHLLVGYYLLNEFDASKVILPTKTEEQIDTHDISKLKIVTLDADQKVEILVGDQVLPVEFVSNFGPFKVTKEIPALTKSLVVRLSDPSKTWILGF